MPARPALTRLIFSPLRRALLPLLGCVACAGALAQEPEQEQPAANDRPIEEINVRGSRTLISMRSAIQRLQEDAYAAFNELNSDDRLDIRCRTVRRTMSYILKRTCEPVFLLETRQDRGREFVMSMRDSFTEDGVELSRFNNSMDLLESESDIKDSLAGRYQQLSEEMLRVAMENPDYYAMLMRLADMKADFEAARRLEFDLEDRDAGRVQQRTGNSEDGHAPAPD